MVVDELWKARVSDHTNDVSAKSRQYQHIVVSFQRLSNVVENQGVLMFKRALPAWEQL